MKRKILAASAAAAMTFGLGASAVSAGPPAGAGEGGKPAGIACQQAGISFLQSNGLLSAVAAGGIEVVELERVAPFQEVLSLHRSNPALFQTGGVSVVVGETVLPATWCDDI